MEKELKIKAKDGKYIYGRLRGSLKNPLVIFVHGLTGHMDEHSFFNGARFFEKKGFSVLQWNQYDWHKDARKLHEVTLKKQAEDMDFMVEYFRKKGAKKIFVIGHSYGGATILFSKNQDFDAAVLWDSSDRPRKLMSEDLKFIKKANIYTISWGTAIILGKQMVEEAKKLPDLFGKMTQFRKPVKIIVAEKGDLVKGGKKYYEVAKMDKDFAIIKNATHLFGEDGTEEKLFSETLKWIKKFNK
jgi:esterase/lipase